MGTFIQDVQEYINFPSSSKDTCNLQEMETAAKQQTHQIVEVRVSTLEVCI